MSKLQTYRVNKVPFDGPTTFKSITERIAQDAKEEGMDIDPKIIASVIQFVFSKRGVLQSIPYFLRTSIKGFGTWIPDKKGVKLREKYYIERNKFNEEFIKRAERARNAVKYTKIAYAKYLETSTAEVKAGYIAWKLASGRKKIIDKRYDELNQLRRAWYKREQNEFHYGKTKLPYKKNKNKRR